MRILLTGGGSGGHAVPIVAVVKALNNRLSTKPQYLWIGSKKGIEADFAQQNNIKFKAVLVGKWRRYFSWDNFLDLFKIPLGVIQSFFVVLNFKADVIFSKGGFASVPAVIAGKILSIPIITHESDLSPGLANKINAYFADLIAYTFPGTEKHFPGKNTIRTSSPLRTEILAGDRVRAQKTFSLNNESPVVLLIGGSQGAQLLNDVLVESLTRLLERYQVIHVCGNDKIDKVKQEIEKLEIDPTRYYLTSFLSGQDLGDAFKLASLVVTRAGSNTLNEIMVVGKPAIVVPIRSAVLGEHQNINARYFGERGAAVVIQEPSLSSRVLIKEINRILTNPGIKENMTKRAKGLAEVEAADKLATEIIRLGK